MGLERKTGAGISTQAWQPYLGGESGSFGEVSREDHAVLGCSFLPCSSGIRRDFAEKKRGERTLAGGQ